MFFLKILTLAIVCIASLSAAVYFTDVYVQETLTKEKTITDALAAARFQEAMKKAEEEARAELLEHNVVLDDIMETVETKPPVTERVTQAEVTEPEITEQTETEITALEVIHEEEGERVTEFRRGGLIDDKLKVPRSVLSLTPEEYEYMSDYLIEHYFLDGYVYAAAEADPAYKAKKMLAADMQNYITLSLDMVMEFLNPSDLMDLLNADFDSMIKATGDLRDEFAAEYSGVSEQGEEFAFIYQSGIKYFNRLIEALTKFKTAANDYHNAANPLVAAMILSSSVDKVLIPEIMGTIEGSYDITEACQEIFLEGTTGAWLLTREEVAQIFINPGLIL